VQAVHLMCGVNTREVPLSIDQLNLNLTTIFTFKKLLRPTRF
jgi:hypothetical protein